MPFANKGFITFTAILNAERYKSSEFAALSHPLAPWYRLVIGHQYAVISEALINDLQL